MKKELSKKSQKVIEGLKRKSEATFSQPARMPSLKSIHELLEELGIEHTFRESSNTVEYRSAGNRYVNSRHEGKKGHLLSVDGCYEMDSSDSYYSWNTWQYAGQLLKTIEKSTK